MKGGNIAPWVPTEKRELKKTILTYPRAGALQFKQGQKRGDLSFWDNSCEFSPLSVYNSGEAVCTIGEISAIVAGDGR